LCWGGLSVYFITSAAFGTKRPAKKPDRIEVLRYNHQPAEEGMDNRVDEETYQQIRAYKKNMDST
jgi:hypothetical protein